MRMLGTHKNSEIQGELSKMDRDKEKLRLRDVKDLHLLSMSNGGMIGVTLCHTYLITWQTISLMEMNIECLYDPIT